MKRPLSRIRPLGPFVVKQPPTEDPNKFTELGFNDGKEVVGVSGTPMPNRDKEPLYVIYVLSGDHVALTSDFSKRVERDINSRDIFGELVSVKVLKSGLSSAKQFKEQAVRIKIPGDELAITESQLQRVQRIIERPGQLGVDVEVKERIYEMAGT